jgi:uncharacterized integral membrane protein
MTARTDHPKSNSDPKGTSDSKAAKDDSVGLVDGGTDIEIGRTRISTLNVSLVAGAVVLILLLVFILENTRRVEISFFGADTHAPLAVALLLSAAVSGLVVGLVALTRIAQVKHKLRK